MCERVARIKESGMTSVLYIEVLKLRCLVITISNGVVVSIVDSGAAGPGSDPSGGNSVFTV